MVEINKSPEENNDENKQDFSVWNIFEDFEDNPDLNEDIVEKEAEVEKNLYYYLNMWTSIIKYISILLAISIILLYFYVDVQKSNKASELFNPICSVLLWSDISYTDLEGIGTWNINTCTSVTLFKNIYEKALKSKSEEIYSKLLKIAKDYYTMKDFINSKEVVFLLDVSENKKNPLAMLAKFDKIKNDFLLNDKLRIQCSDIEVTDSEFKADCFAYSSAWDRNTIPWFNWWKNQNDLVWWTSISLASSFLNYLETQDDFILLEKQKVFKIQAVAWEWAFSYKTPFTVKLAKRKLNLK